MPLDKAQDLFSHLLDKWDRLTVKAYFGVQEHTSERIIDRTARYASGTLSVKKIHLRQKVAGKIGYLERLGLASFEKHGSAWFMVLNECSLVPEMRLSSTRAKETARGIIANLSLTPKHVLCCSANGCGEGEENEIGIVEREKRERVIGVDIKSLEGIQNCIHLSPQEEAILKAKPCGAPDRSKVSWSKEPFKPQFEEEPG